MNNRIKSAQSLKTNKQRTGKIKLKNALKLVWLFDDFINRDICQTSLLGHQMFSILMFTRQFHLVCLQAQIKTKKYGFRVQNKPPFRTKLERKSSYEVNNSLK